MNDDLDVSTEPLEAPLASEGATEFEPASFGEDSAAPAAAPEDFVSRAEYEETLAALEQERTRNRDVQAWFDQVGRKQQLETTVRGELERMYRDHAAQQQQAAQMAAPTPSSVEEWLVEPSQIADYVARYGQWVQQTTLQQLAPFLQRFALYDSLLPAVLTREAEGSITRAKQMLEAEGISDFDELRPEIEQAFAQNPAGARLLLDPSTVAAVYHFLARQRGVQPVREKARTVPTAGVSRAGASRAGAPAKAVSSAVRAVAERLQINPNRLAERLSERRPA